MSGNPKGGVKAALTNKERHGEDFYVRIGTLGGAKSRNGGFAQNRELAREAGRRGGKASRRTAIKQVEAEAIATEKEHAQWKQLKKLG